MKYLDLTTTYEFVMGPLNCVAGLARQKHFGQRIGRNPWLLLNKRKTEMVSRIRPVMPVK